MPTFQTTPYKPWIFPDEAYHMNHKGMQPLRPMPLSSLDLLRGGGSEAHALFSNHEHSLVHQRLRVNKKKEQGMLGIGQMNERSQRYVRPASRSDVPNGVFHGSPMQYAASSGLRGGRFANKADFDAAYPTRRDVLTYRGGVITTSEGQSWLAQRLKQRAQEYGERSSGSFSPRPPITPDVTPNNDVDTLLQAVFTAFTAGSFTSSLNDTLNKLLQAFIKVGATITPSQLTTYSQAIEKLMITSRAYEGDLGQLRGAVVTEPKEKRLRALDSINNTLRIIDAALKEIARIIYEPLSARQQVMGQLQSRLISRQVAEFKPGFVGTEEGTAFDVPPGEVQLGEVRPSRALLPSRSMPSSSLDMEESVFGDGPSNLPGMGTRLAPENAVQSVVPEDDILPDLAPVVGEEEAGELEEEAAAEEEGVAPGGEDEECEENGAGRVFGSARRRNYRHQGLRF